MEKVQTVITAAVILVLAAHVNEGIIEFFLVPFVDWLLPKDEKDARRQNARTAVINLLAGVLGVMEAISFNIGLFALLGAEVEYEMADYILTGCLFGRGANYVHLLVKRFMVQTEDTELDNRLTKLHAGIE
jgi:hypothetical protein